MGSRYAELIANMKRVANHDFGWFMTFLDQYAWSIEVMMILLLTLLLAYVEHVIYHKLHPEFMKKKKLWQHAFIHALHRPLLFLIWLVGVSFSLELCIGFFTNNGREFFIPTIRKIGVLSLIVWFAIAYIQEIERLFLSRKDDGHFLDKTSVRAVGQIMRIIVLLGGAFFILQSTLGVGASAVVAFAGGGSFIIGWAAKDGA
jgi:MscS family membrane protein